MPCLFEWGMNIRTHHPKMMVSAQPIKAANVATTSPATIVVVPYKLNAKSSDKKSATGVPLDPLPLVKERFMLNVKMVPEAIASTIATAIAKRRNQRRTTRRTEATTKTVSKTAAGQRIPPAAAEPWAILERARTTPSRRSAR